MRMTHKQDSVELDGNVALHTHKDFHFSLYHKHTLKEGGLNGKLHVRAHHPNAIVSVGFESLDILKQVYFNKAQLSLWALGGLQKEGISVFGGAYAGLDVEKKSLAFANFLVGLKHEKGTAHLLLDTKTQEVEINKEDGSTEKKEVLQKNFKVTCDSKVNNDLSIFANAETDLTKLKAVVFGGEYNLGDNNKLKAKLVDQLKPNKDKKKPEDRDLNLSLALIHNYNNMINFSFVTKVL
jgi:hypothetical protein